MNLFLDTSAIIKLYHQEVGTEKFSKYLSDIKGDLFLTTSDLTKLELHSTLLKRSRMKEISNKNLVQLFRLLEKDFQNFNIVVINQVIKDIAIQLLDSIGLKYGLRTLDSLQLASSLYSNNYFKIDYFVSSDKKLLNIAKEYFPIINPEKL